jgi:hypothetical protein
MAENQEVSAKMGEALNLAAQCFQAEKSEGYESLSEELEELEAFARESFKDHADYKSLLHNLEKGNPLAPDELKTLKLLIVGDADYYLKYDDDFDRCESELKKIVEGIRGLQSSNLDVDGLMHLRVLCREACSVARPTAFYLEQKERLRKFEDATRDGIDRESGQFLANIVKTMMNSSNT